MRFLPTTGMPRVAVIGFGYVGCCIGTTLAARGADVVAVDDDEHLVGEIAAGRCPIPEPGLAEGVAAAVAAGRLRISATYEGVADADVVLLTVGTPVAPDGSLLVGALERACRELAATLRPGTLVIVKSTVSPGTTRTLVARTLDSSGLRHGEDYGLAYCPERLAEGVALEQVRSLPVVVGGCGADSTAAASEFWRRALGVPVHEVASPDAAEIVKLATNWWIDANIAIANELAQVCTEFDVDVLDVVRSANELPKGQRHVNILIPSIGVGGSCLTKDPWMIWRAARDRGVDLQTVPAARGVNDSMPDHARELIAAGLLDAGRDPAAAKVAVLGVSFKNDTGDLRHTPVLGVVDGLVEAGAKVVLHDPLADPVQVFDVFGLDLEPDLEAAVTAADCVAILAGHSGFRDLDLDWLRSVVADRCLLFDGRMYYPPEEIERIRSLGFGYRGIGR